MTRRSSNFFPLIALAFASFGQVAPAAPDLVLSEASRMAVEPSSASLAGGNARLTTTTLRRESARYVGNYQIQVRPYFFKDETGTLSIPVSDESLRKLARGTTVHFAGNALTTGTETARAVKVKATPAGAGTGKGNLTISIATENGELVFFTGYTLGDD